MHNVSQASYQADSSISLSGLQILRTCLNKLSLERMTCDLPSHSLSPLMPVFFCRDATWLPLLSPASFVVYVCSLGSLLGERFKGCAWVVVITPATYLIFDLEWYCMSSCVLCSLSLCTTCQWHLECMSCLCGAYMFQISPALRSSCPSQWRCYMPFSLPGFASSRTTAGEALLIHVCPAASGTQPNGKAVPDNFTCRASDCLMPILSHLTWQIAALSISLSLSKPSCSRSMREKI